MPKAVFTHIVSRAFTVGGHDLVAGDAVNASSWRNTDKLVTTGYLRPANEADYARTQTVRDTTPPPAPTKTKVAVKKTFKVTR